MQRPIHQIVTVIAFLVLIWVCQSCSKDDHSPRVLIFNKTEFVFHESTAAGTAALEKLCQENNYRVDITEEGEYFTQENLQQYAAIIFLNTAGDVLNYKQEAEFERYIQAGGSFVGLHTAVDTEHNWKWFGNLVGAMFDGQSSEQKASLVVQDDQHPATQNLEANWSRRDEWLNLKNISPDVNVLLTVDENSYPGGTMGAFHPVSWYHDYDGGRAFVTTMGHSKSSYEDPVLLKHLLGALQYAIGNNQPLDYNKPRATTAPAATTGGTGFVKTSVVCDLYEPMELAMFPDGKILFIERRGALKVYDPGTGATKVVDELAVFIKHEEGLLGLSLDPNWAKNHWIYLFYTPEDDDEAIRLSRFEFFNDALVRSSEKILLKIPTLRDPRHYHAAGSIEFDDQGFLYLAMGDNSAHRDGYSSLDERPDEQAFDSQKASSNSMDLRGKILRIKPLPDGSYLCPAGNMYTNQAQVVSFEAQPFLNDPLLKDFVQQRLNTLAQENGSLPPGTFDTDSTAACAFPFLTNAKAGAGLPEIFVMGVRNPYRISFDSRRRTLYWGEPGPDAGVADPNWGPEGYDEVNAARTAGFYGWPYFVGPNKAYRDYDHFTDTPGEYFDPLHPVNFSLNNTGTPYLPATRKPLIWYPFSSSTEFPLLANGTRCAMAGPTYYCDQYPAETRFPDEFNGKLIIYDWMRNWMRAVQLDSLGNYVAMDPLADNLRVSRPIDMIIDKKGSLWVLEYGTEWYSTNPDACLSRIDFVRGDGKSAPIAEAEAKSPVRWDFGNKNRSFYKPGDVLPYKVVVTDPASVDPAALHLAIEYKETEQNAFAFAKTYRPVVPKNEFARGQSLLEGSDCKSCHAVDRQVNGPAYLAISERYSQDKAAPAKLTQKVIAGGSGNWGERAMSAHPQLAAKDVGDMVRWILSLREQTKKAMPLQGRYTLATPPSGSVAAQGLYVFSATNGTRPCETLVLRPTLQQVEKADSCSKGVRTYKRPLNATTTVMTELKNQQFFVFKHIDLRGIKSIAFAAEMAALQKQTGGGTLELRLDTPDGRLAGTLNVPVASPAGGVGLSELILTVDQAAWPSDGSFYDLYFVVKNAQAGEAAVLGVDWVRFEW